MVEYLDADLERLPVERVGQLVLVRWVDCTGIDSWVDLDSLEQQKLLECETVGRIVSQDEKVLRLSSSRHSGPRVMHSNVIPMPCILEIVQLLPYRNSKDNI